MGTDGKKKLRLRRMSNTQLQELYQAELQLRHRSKEALAESRRILGHFIGFLADRPPTAELATTYLAGFASLKPTTLHRYHAVINGFMTWYGERLSTRIKVPQPLPDYVEDEAVDKLRQALSSKKTHKKVIARNLLLVDMAADTGLRRAELAHLKVGDIDLSRNYLVVRQGKGQKDRIVDLTPSLGNQLRIYLKGKSPSESVFGLKPGSISDIIRRAAKKSGTDLHTHSLRDYFGTRLVDRGVDLETVRRLMGHEHLDVTQRYLGRTDAQRREAIRRLDDPVKAPPTASPGFGGEDRRPERRWREEVRAHQRALLQLARALRDGLATALWSVPTRDLGRPATGGNSLDHHIHWRVGPEGTVELCHPVEVDDSPETAALWGQLTAHLRDSDLAWLVGDPERGLPGWRRLGGQELSLRVRLLEAIDADITSRCGQPPQVDPAPSGPTLHFSQTIAAAAVDGLHRGVSYGEPEASVEVCFGPFLIARETDSSGPPRYQTWHRNLMEKWAAAPETARIRQLEQQRAALADRMERALTEMLVAGAVPGECPSCP